MHGTAGDGAAVQLGMAIDVQLVATRAGLDAALLAHAGVVAYANAPMQLCGLVAAELSTTLYAAAQRNPECGPEFGGRTCCGHNDIFNVIVSNPGIRSLVPHGSESDGRAGFF